MELNDDITAAMQRVDRAAGKILDRNGEQDELLRASLSLLNKIRRQ